MSPLSLPLSADELDAVLLDVDGTVLAEDIPLLEAACRRMADASGGAATAERIGTWWADRWFELCDLSSGDRFRLCSELLPQSIDDTVAHYGIRFEVAAWAEAITAYAGRAVPVPDAPDFIAEVPVPVCIVSNRDKDNLLASLALAGLDGLDVVTSEDARAYKPLPRPFEMALELTGTSPERTLHIGDSYRADVCGAAAVGIRTAWLNRDGKQPPPDATANPDLVVRTLLELVRAGR